MGRGDMKAASVKFTNEMVSAVAAAQKGKPTGVWSKRWGSRSGRERGREGGRE